MMRHPLLRCATLGLAATLAYGCEEKPVTPATPTSTAEPAVTPTMQNAKDQAAATADAAAAKANQAGAAVDGATDSVVAQAQSLYQKASDALAKMDAKTAQGYVDQLSAMKAKLPADWQTKVTQLETMLADVKKNAAALPAMPKVGP